MSIGVINPTTVKLKKVGTDSITVISIKEYQDALVHGSISKANDLITFPDGTQYVLSSVQIGEKEKEHILIGKIKTTGLVNNINDKPAAASIEFNFPAAKPANKNVIALYVKTIGVFTSPTPGVTIHDTTTEVTGVSFKLDNLPFINQAGFIISAHFGLSDNVQEDVKLTMVFDGGVNPKDFLPGGELGIYFELEDTPSLN